MTHENANQDDGRKDTCRAAAAAVPKQGRFTLGNRGLTLIELLVVILLIGILSLLAMAVFSKAKDNAKVARCEAEIRSLEKTVYSFYTDKGRYPDNWAELTPGVPPMNDPWGKPYVYTKIDNNPAVGLENGAGTQYNDDFDLYSEGANGNHVDSYSYDPAIPSVSDDDVVRGGDGAYLGLRSSF